MHLRAPHSGRLIHTIRASALVHAVRARVEPESGVRQSQDSARLNIENLLRAPCKFSVFSALNLDLVSKYCNLHGARGLNTGISQRIFGRNFRNSELNLEIGSKSEPKCSRFSL